MELALHEFAVKLSNRGRWLFGYYDSECILLFAAVLLTMGCKGQHPKTTLVYFGFDDQAEKAEDLIRLAKTWGESPPCPRRRATIKREETDYEVLFGTADVTITDHRGQVLYNGGTGVLYYLMEIRMAVA